MQDKVTIKIFTNRNQKWQREKAKFMFLSMIKKEDIVRYLETQDDILIETETHEIKIIGMTNTPRGHRANFIIDLSGFPEAIDTAMYKSTYDWNFEGEGETFRHLFIDSVDNQLKNNGYNIELEELR